MRFPGDDNRLAIIGMTGSGKTHAGMWHLSLRSWHLMPWIIFDFKLDDKIGQIPGLKRVDVRDKPPKSPGIYAVSPLPSEADQEATENYMWQIWANERTGVFIDEGYMIPRYSEALRALLTQGRSKRIPVIMLSQRPSWISPFLLSESEFIQLYFIQNPADLKTMREWVPFKGEVPGDFQSLYYDVKSRDLRRFAPMPDVAKIMQRFADRQPKRRRPLF